MQILPLHAPDFRIHLSALSIAITNNHVIAGAPYQFQSNRGQKHSVRE
jgi:hypothetical protein